MTVNNFGDINMEENPTFELYGNNVDIKRTPEKPPEELEPTPDLLADIYFNAPIVFPRQSMMARGKVVSRKQDVYGNPIIIENANPRKTATIFGLMTSRKICRTSELT